MSKFDVKVKIKDKKTGKVTEGKHVVEAANEKEARGKALGHEKNEVLLPNGNVIAIPVHVAERMVEDGKAVDWLPITDMPEPPIVVIEPIVLPDGTVEVGDYVCEIETWPWVPPAPTPSPYAPEPKSKTWMFIVGGVIAVIIAAIVAFKSGVLGG